MQKRESENLKKKCSHEHFRKDPCTHISIGKHFADPTYPPLGVYIICESSLQNKPGFKELGSVTPYDVAVKIGNKEIAAMILKKVNEDKGNKRCEYTCPPVKIGIPILSSCYQPDLMEGTNTQSSYFQRTRTSPWHYFPL